MRSLLKCPEKSDDFIFFFFFVNPQHSWWLVFNHCHFSWSNQLSGFWSFKGSLSYESGPIYLRLCLCNFNTTCPHIIKIPTSTAGKIWKADLESGWKKKAQTFCVAILHCPHSLEGFSNVTFVLADEVSHTKQMISGITQWKHLGEQLRNQWVAGMCNDQLRQARSWFGHPVEVRRVGAYFLFFFLIVFIYFYLCWVFIAALAFL